MSLRAAEDWVYASELLWVVRSHGIPDAEHARLAAIGLVAGLVAEGLVVLGDVTRGGHRPWDLSPEASVLRAASDWLSQADPVVGIGDVFWLATTPAGQAIGEAVWAREVQT